MTLSSSNPPITLSKIDTTIEQPIPHAIPAVASCSRSSGVGAFSTFGSPPTANPIANFITIFDKQQPETTLNRGAPPGRGSDAMLV